MRSLEEAQALIDALWAQARGIEKQARQSEALNLRIQIIEKWLRTNSRNFAVPPSSNPHRPPAKKPRTGKKRGAHAAAWPGAMRSAAHVLFHGVLCLKDALRMIMHTLTAENERF